MGAGWIILICLAIYLVGAMFWYAIDGWINYSEGDRDAPILVGFLWPIFMWFVIADSLRTKLKEAKKNKTEKQQLEKRIRIAEEKKLEKEIELLDQELALDVSSRRQKQA